MNPYDAAHSLAASIKKSNEYQSFKQAYQELKNDSTANNIFNDLRKIQLEIQEHQIKGEDVPAETEEKFKKLSEAASYNLTVKNFMEAEYRFATIIKDIQKIIADAVEVEEIE